MNNRLVIALVAAAITGLGGVLFIEHQRAGGATADARSPTPTSVPVERAGMQITPPAPSVVPPHRLPLQPTPYPPTPEPAVYGPPRMIPTESAPVRRGGGE